MACMEIMENIYLLQFLFWGQFSDLVDTQGKYVVSGDVLGIAGI